MKKMNPEKTRGARRKRSARKMILKRLMVAAICVALLLQLVPGVSLVWAAEVPAGEGTEQTAYEGEAYPAGEEPQEGLPQNSEETDGEAENAQQNGEDTAAGELPGGTEEPQPAIAAMAGEAFEIQGDFQIQDTGACSVPAYCTNDACTCKEGDPTTCICDDSCGCRTAVVHTCPKPQYCTNAGCLCGSLGKDYCICDETCNCYLPDFTVQAETKLLASGAEVSVLPSGKMGTVTVDFQFQSVDATFSDMVIKTYVEGTLKTSEIEVEGGLELLGVAPYVGADGKEYTEITIKSYATGVAAGVYSFDVYFPAGVTEDGTEATVFSIVEGKVYEGGKEWTFGEAENKKPRVDVAATVEADASWNVFVSNKELDYKDPGDTNIFRQEVRLTRNPDTGDEGVYYLLPEGGLTVKLIGDAFYNEAAANLQVLRITTASGADVPYTLLSSNVIYIAPQHIPFSPGFSGSPQASAAANAALYVVYSMDETYIKSISNEIIGGFYEFKDGVETSAVFEYEFVDGNPHDARAAEGLEFVSYTPGQGGKGSIGKWASPYIEGKTFFKAADDAQAVPIRYTVNYVNNSNTPVTGLTITDERPLMYASPTGGSTPPLSTTLGVPAGSVYISRVSMESWTDTYASADLACVVIYDAGSGDVSTPIAPGGYVDIPQEANNVRLEFTGELKHGFGTRLYFDVLGDTALDGAGMYDMSATKKEIRDKINYIYNRAAFTATSTKQDGNGNYQTLSGGDGAYVHVYPYDDEVQNPVWTLAGAVSATSAVGTSDVVSVPRGSGSSTVYYHLTATPVDEMQYAYSPVFYFELPAEVNFANGAGDITYAGSAEGLSLVEELLPNPNGSGKLLKLSSADKTVLDPNNGPAVISIRCTINPETPYGTEFSSKVYFGLTDPNTQLDMGKYAAGEYTTSLTGFDVPGTSSFLLQDGLKVTINGSGSLEGAFYVQTELDRASGDWHRYPEVAEALPGGLLTYKMMVKNGGTLDAKNLVLYNVFSSQSDSYLIDGKPRNSAWDPYLAGPVSIPNATVYYSEFSNHRLTSSGQYSGADDWTETPYSYALIKAIKIVFDDGYKLPGGQTLTLEVPMYAPVGYQCTGAVGGDLAISSLATQFVFDTQTRTTALEPLKVAVHLTPNTKGEISGIVWGDTNPKNGAKDKVGEAEPDEFPEAGITVWLYKDGGPLYSTTTDADGNYKFTNLGDGNYTVRAVLPTGYTESVAGLHNKFMTTGTMMVDSQMRNYIETDAPIVVGATKEHKNIDAAIYALPGTIAGTVWRDIGADGLRSAAADKDVGISGATVQLYRILRGGISEMVGEKQTVGGAYTFTDVPAGRYYVLFKVPDNYAAVAVPDTLTDTVVATLAGYPGVSQGAKTANAATKGKIGQGLEIWLDPAEDQLGIDCGFTPNPGKIAGVIWQDMNGDGVRDNPADAGQDGKVVLLYKTAGYQADAGTIYKTETTSDGGKFEFADLTPGTYKVVYACAGTEEYISCFDGAAIAEAARVGTGEYTSIEVAPEGTLVYADKDFGTVRKFKISGRVFDDKNSNKTYQDTGSPADDNIAATTVTIKRDGAPIAGSPFSTGAGGYESGYLWPGNYTVEFSNIPSTYADYLVLTEDAGVGAVQFSRADKKWTLTGMASASTAGENKNLALVRPRTIEGIVWHDRDGNKAFNGDDNYLARTLTLKQGTNMVAVPGNPATSLALDGTYRFEGLYPNVTYTITVDLEDTPKYAITNAGSGLTAGGIYTVIVEAADKGAAADPKNKNFGLAKPVSFSGMIWQDKDISSAYVSDGIYTSGVDTPLAINTVAQLYRDSGSGYVLQSGKTANSNASGVYTFINLLPGDYKVVLLPGADQYYITGPAATSVTLPTAANGSAAFAQSDPADLTVSTGTWTNIVLKSEDAALSGLDLSVGEYRTVSGVLWHDINGDGNKDTGTEGVFTAAETISLVRSTDGTVYSAYTSGSTASGAYSFKLKPGKYKVVAPRNSRRLTNPEADLLAGLTNGSPADPYWTVDYASAADTNAKFANKDFLFSVYSTIEGKVWVDINADGAQASPEGAKTGVTLTLERTDGSTEYASWWADYKLAGKNIVSSVGTNGEYSFGNLWPGTYTVTLSCSDISGYLRTNRSTNSRVSQVGENQWQWQVIVNSKETDKVDFGMAKPSTLSGDVFRDKNNDKNKSTGEGSIGKATLVRQGVLPTMQGYSKTIDIAASSGFTFEGLLSGTYKMTLSEIDAAWLRTFYATALTASGGTATFTADPANDRVYTVVIADSSGGGMDISGAEAGYAVPGTIGGTVFDDADQNQLKGALEDTLTGVIAKLEREDSAVFTEVFTPVTVQTNANGEFRFANLLPGKYRLTFLNIGGTYLTTTADKTLFGGTDKEAVFTKSTRTWIVTIKSDGQSVALDTGMVGQGAASGMIWKDVNADGQNVGEDPYVGVTVKLFKDYTGTKAQVESDQTTQAGTGAYSFAGLYPGTYTVEVTSPAAEWYVTNTGTDVKTNVWTKEITVAEDGSTQNINFGLTQLISISGKVWIDRNASGGTFEPGTDDEAANAKLTVAGTPGTGTYAGATIYTQTDGTYTITGLVPGTYTVRLTDDSYTKMVLMNSTLSSVDMTGSAALTKTTKTWEVTGKSGHAQAACDFIVAEKAALTVVVWEDADGNGLMADTEQGVKDIAVKVYKDVGGGSYTQEVTGDMTKTNEGGVYVLHIGETGSYRVEITLPGADFGVTKPLETIYQDFAVSSLSTEIEKTFGIAKYLTFGGRVWTELDGNGQYDALLSADAGVNAHDVVIKLGGVQKAALQTGTDGKYEAGTDKKLLPGSYTIEIGSYAGHLVSNTGTNFDAGTRVWTAAGLLSGVKTENLDCAFTPIRKIVGTVWHDEDGDGAIGSESELVGDTVKLYKWDGSSYQYAGETTTGAGGAFEFDNLQPGDYMAEVVKDGYRCTNPVLGKDNIDQHATYSFGVADTPSDYTKDATIGLAQPVCISGRAYIDKDSSGVYDANVDEAAPVRMTVERILPSPAQVCSYVLDGGCAFDLAPMKLLPGEYMVTFDAVAGHAVGTNADTDFDLPARTWQFVLLSGGTHENTDIRYVREEYVVSGVVWKDTDGDGEKGRAEQMFKLAEGVTVVVSHPVYGDVVATVEDDGTYKAVVAGPGEFTVRATLPSGYCVTNRGANYDREKDEFSASLSYDSWSATVDIGAAMAVKVSGMMWMDTNANALYEPHLGETPLKNAQITLVPYIEDANVSGIVETVAQAAGTGYIEAQAVTDANGGYVFPAVKPGNYTVKLAQLPGSKHYYTGYRGENAPDENTCTFHIKYGHWKLAVGDCDLAYVNSGYHDPSEISGVLIDKNTDEPVPNQSVRLYKMDDDGTYKLHDETVTDAKGNYLFDYLLPGQYRVEVDILDGYEVDAVSKGVQEGAMALYEVAITEMGQAANEAVYIKLMTEEQADTGEEETDGPGIATGDAGTGAAGGGQAGSGGRAVKTGDESRLPLFIVLLLVAAGTFAGIAVYRKKGAGKPRINV